MENYTGLPVGVNSFEPHLRPFSSRGMAILAMRPRGILPLVIAKKQGRDGPATHGRDAHATFIAEDYLPNTRFTPLDVTVICAQNGSKWSYEKNWCRGSEAGAWFAGAAVFRWRGLPVPWFAERSGATTPREQRGCFVPSGLGEPRTTAPTRCCRCRCRGRCRSGSPRAGSPKPVVVAVAVPGA